MTDISLFIAGDFNINMLNVDADTRTINFLNLLSTFYLTPVITKPSRINEASENHTLQDNIFCKNSNMFISGLFIFFV